MLDYFQVAVNDPQCKHVLFGADGRPKYLQMLQTHFSYRDKVTLITGSIPGTSVRPLGWKEVSMPSVFRSKGLARISVSKGAQGPVQVIPGPHAEYGGFQAYQQQGSVKSAEVPLCPSVTDTATPDTKPQTPATEASPYSNYDAQGLIPVNNSFHRLDIPISSPTKTQWKLWAARIARKKLCNHHQILKNCKNATCQNDHEAIDRDILYVLRYMCRQYPCPKMGKCRDKTCYIGHVCLQRRCATEKATSCKMARAMHGVDNKVAGWIDPETGLIKKVAQGDEVGRVERMTENADAPLIDL